MATSRVLLRDGVRRAGGTFLFWNVGTKVEERARSGRIMTTIGSSWERRRRNGYWRERFRDEGERERSPSFDDDGRIDGTLRTSGHVNRARTMREGGWRCWGCCSPCWWGYTGRCVCDDARCHVVVVVDAWYWGRERGGEDGCEMGGGDSEAGRPVLMMMVVCRSEG